MLIYFLLDTVALPASILYLLGYRYRSLLQKRSGPQYLAIRARFGALFTPFAPHASLWQVAILLRRVLCVLIDTFMTQAPRNLCFMLVHFFFLMLHIRIKPSATELANQLETASLVLLVLLSALLTAYPIDQTLGVQVLTFLLVVAPLIAWLIVIGMARWRGLGKLATSQSQAKLEIDKSEDEISSGEIDFSSRNRPQNEEDF